MTTRKHKVAKTLSTAEAAYIAGLVDGEGTVTLTRKHCSENRQLALTISSTELVLLNHVRHCTGVGKITNKAPSKEHHLKSFTYAVYNRQALQVLQQISPYMLSYKSSRANLALREYTRVTPRNGKYNSEQREARLAFESEFFSIKP
jgi:hypothetical protein